MIVSGAWLQALVMVAVQAKRVSIVSLLYRRPKHSAKRRISPKIARLRPRGKPLRFGLGHALLKPQARLRCKYLQLQQLTEEVRHNVCWACSCSNSRHPLGKTAGRLRHDRRQQHAGDHDQRCLGHVIVPTFGARSAALRIQCGPQRSLARPTPTEHRHPGLPGRAQPRRRRLVVRPGRNGPIGARPGARVASARSVAGPCPRS